RTPPSMRESTDLSTVPVDATSYWENPRSIRLCLSLSPSFFLAANSAASSTNVFLGIYFSPSLYFRTCLLLYGSLKTFVYSILHSVLPHIGRRWSSEKKYSFPQTTHFFFSIMRTIYL